MTTINRTKNTARNAIWGFIDKIILMILPFITRTLILKLIGEEYLGLNGLFTSIITVLNIADLGFGAAITYSMYKPIADNDNETLCAILNFYRKIYRIIGCIIFIVGFLLMPFLPNLIKGDVPPDINLYLLFLIYLVNTTLGYLLFAYKRSLLHAYHRDDKVSKIAVSLNILQYAIQILVLSLFKSYYAYVIVLPLITLVGNIATSIVSKKMFPQLECRGCIDPSIMKKIKKQVSGAFIGKICGQMRTALDGIFISSFLGLTQVAIYSNYYYILSAIHNFMTVTTNSMVGGVGNSIAKEDLEKNYKDFQKFTFLYAWIAGWFSCCLVCLYQPFMRLWTGEDLMLPFGTMILFCIYLYIMSASDIKNVYYTARGLWWEGRWRAIIEVVVNLVLHYFAAKYCGIFGIILASIITMASVNFVYGVAILFKHYFINSSLTKYLLTYLKYLIITIFVCSVSYYICSYIPDTSIVNMIVIAIISTILSNLLFYAFYSRTAVFDEVKPLFIRLIGGIIHKFYK